MDLNEATNEQLIEVINTLKKENQQLKSNLNELLINSNIKESINKSPDISFSRYFELPITGRAITDINKKWIMVNNTICEMFGYTTEELFSKTWAELTYPDDLNKDLHLFEKVMSNEIDGYNIEKRFVKKNGNLIYTLLIVQCLRNNLGDVEYFNALIIDMTEQKLLEMALKESEEKFRLITENVSDVLWILNISHQKFTYISPSIIKLRGYTPEEALLQDISQSLTPDSAKIVIDALQENLPKFLASQIESPVYYHELQQPCKDGRLVDVETATSYHFNKYNEVEVIGVSRDITARKKIESSLVESEQNYKNLANSGRALIWIANTDKLCYYFNKVWLDFTGRTLEQEFGNGWAEGVHPDDFDKCLETYITAFDKREDFSMEYRLRRADGEYRWLLDDGSPIYNSSGEFTGYVGHCLDITDRKNAEAKLQELLSINEITLQQKTLLLNELAKSERKLITTNNQKDKFFSIIAHDLKSPFTGFLGLTRLMIDQIDNLSVKEILSFLVQLQDSAGNLYNLLENLLTWSRIQRGLMEFNPEKTTLNTISNRSISTLKDFSLQKDITINSSIPDQIFIFADIAMLDTVFRNLLTNAIKFTAKGGKIELSAEVSQNNQEIIVYIRDNGIGMNDNIRSNLFQLDAKISRKGTNGESSTGLGLLLVKEFIDKHSGKIWVESQESVGTTFYFSIPIR